MKNSKWTSWQHHGVLLFLGGVATACGYEVPAPADVAKSQEALTASHVRVLGFESPLRDWSTSQGTLSASTIASEGTSSLGILSNGWTQIDSVMLSSLGEVGTTVSYDVRLPSDLPYWGETRLQISIPSLGIAQELGPRSLIGLAPGVFHRVTFTLPSSIVTALEGVYSDLQFRVILNVPGFTQPYLIDHLDVNAPVDNDLTPYQARSFAFDVPEAYIPELVTVSASDRVTMGSNSRVLDGLLVGARNSATLGAGAGIANSMRVDGNVTLGGSSFVTGLLQYSGTLTNRGGTIGTPAPVPDVPFKTIRFGVAVPNDKEGNVTVNPGAPRSLLPAAYGALLLNSNAIVRLRSGSYFFDSLTVYAGATLEVDSGSGPIQIYVGSGVNFQGRFVQTAGMQGDLLLGYSGASEAFIQGPFVGTLVAPNATISLHRPNTGESHRGAFFGKRVEFASGATVNHRPFPWHTVLDPSRAEWASLLDHILETWRVKSGTPALAAALVEDGSVVWAGANGVKNASLSTPVNTGDYFMLKSCTKPMTGYLVARLIQEGLIVPSTGLPLDWDTKLTDVFPDITTIGPAPNPDSTDVCQAGFVAQYATTTIAQLMSHTSGQAYAPGCEPADEYASLSPSIVARRRLYANEAARDLPQAPSPYGGGSIVVASMLESLTGLTWEQLMQEFVYDQLGMVNSGVGQNPFPPSTRGVASHVLTQSGATFIATVQTPPSTYGNEVHAPAGRDPHASILDFANFAGANLPFASTAATAPVSPAVLLRSFALALPGQSTATWSGWFEEKFAMVWGQPIRRYGHNGSDGMDYSRINVYPERNFAAVAMSNSAPSGIANYALPPETMQQEMLMIETISRSLPDEFDRNYTLGATATGSVLPFGPGFEPDKAVDGLLTTRWATPNVSSATLTVTFDSPRLIQYIRIIEEYAQITGFRLEVQHTSSGLWQTVMTGASIGRNFLAHFTPRTVNAVRLVVTAGNGPTINEIWAY